MNLQDTFKNRMHSQRLILKWNETFCKGAIWIHIAQSKGPVAGHYMIMNSRSAKCNTVRDLTMSQQCCWWFSFPGIKSGVVGKIFPAFLKCFTLKIKVSCSFQMFGTTHTVTVSHPTGLQSHTEYFYHSWWKNKISGNNIMCYENTYIFGQTMWL